MSGPCCFKEAPVGYRGLQDAGEGSLRGFMSLQRGPGWIPGITSCMTEYRPEYSWLQRGPGWIPGITSTRSAEEHPSLLASKRPRLDTGDYTPSMAARVILLSRFKEAPVGYRGLHEACSCKQRERSR